MAKHDIDLLQPDTGPVYTAPYRASPILRKFEMAEIGKMAAENVSKPADNFF